MTGISEIPSSSRIRGYDYANSIWRSIAVNLSGEVGLRRGEIIDAQQTILITAASGGQAAGSGLSTSGYAVDRVILKIPNMSVSGTNAYGEFFYSGNTGHGMWVGGKSGDAPYPGVGFVGSGKGLFLGPGDEKELYVQQLDEIYLAAETSGSPVTVIAECITQ